MKESPAASGGGVDMVDTLPVAAVLGELKSALNHHKGAVLQAPPGAGKTTLVPLALLDQAWLARKRILLLEPRRLAARAAAGRMAALRGESVGRTVGYRMRLDRKTGPLTRIEVVTEGVLTRMLQKDPGLKGVGLVIFDEFHERSLQADLGLTLCMEVQAVLNVRLRLLAMSATLETERLAAFLGNVPVIRCQGRQYPVETRYGPPRRRRGVEKRVVTAVRQAAATHDASILAFLPGAAEIGRAARGLEKSGLGAQWIICPLFGRLSRAAQDRAIQPAPVGRRKIVLASAIAETSLTIEGVNVVVDSGFMRGPRFDAGSGLTRLVTSPVSRAAADQRRGRAGRTAAGVCYRLWSEAENAALVPAASPEITVSDMAGLAIELALWGVRRPDDLGWLDAPPQGAYAEACKLLQRLGALDGQRRITPHGRRMAALPIHPRLGHMLINGKAHALGEVACDVAAMLSEGDFLRLERDARDVDLQLRLDCLDFLRRDGRWHPDGFGLDRTAAKRILKLAGMLKRRLNPPPDQARQGSTGRLLAWAYPDRIARRRSDGAGRFLLASGRGAWLNPDEPLAGCEYIVAAELDGDRSDARIFLAAAYDGDALQRQHATRLIWKSDVAWNTDRQRVEALRRCYLGALVVKTERLHNPDAAQLGAALLTGIRAQGLDCLPWTPSLRVWSARVTFLNRRLGGAWPDLSDKRLLETLDDWLAPFVSGLRRLRDLTARDLERALSGFLDWRQARDLDHLAPCRLTVPSGRRIAVDYRSDPPVLAVKLQEMFGQLQTPRVAGGRQAVLVHLLSPAGRPVQITQDLAGFWKNGYNAVRKDMRGRYPKHYWPEDPFSAQATAGVRPRNT